MKKKAIFVFAWNTKDVWSTPLSLIESFRTFSTYEVSIVNLFVPGLTTYRPAIGVLSEICQQLTPNEENVVVYMDYGRWINPNVWIEIKRRFPKTLLVMECGDDPQNFHLNKKSVSCFDVMWTSDYPSFVEYKKTLNSNVLWIPHFAHPFKDELTSHIKTRNAVTTRGAGSSIILDTLHSLGLIVNQNVTPGIEHHRFLSSAHIVVQHSRWGEITRRVFEAAYAGAMVLTDRLDNSRMFNELGFRDGETIVYYNDLSDCVRLLNYYTHIDTSKRNEISLAGQRLVREKYTADHVTKKLLDTISKCTTKTE